MKKLAKKLSSTMFDVAAAPLLLVIFGIPILIVTIIVVLIIVTVKLIVKARKKNMEQIKPPDEYKSPGNDL